MDDLPLGATGKPCECEDGRTTTVGPDGSWTCDDCGGYMDGDD